MANEIKKFIDFIITQKCSYACPYCSQSKNSAKVCNHADKETIKSFYGLLDNLEKDFEITITGGEAILHPDFFEIIQTVKQKGFKINLISNLSFNMKTYQMIFDLLDDSLNRFDISFHLNQIQNFNSTLEKIEKFLIAKPDNTNVTFFIPLYMIDAKKSKKIDELVKVAKKYNINYSFQKIRFLNQYKEETQKKYFSQHSVNKTFGKFCYAGYYSAIIYEDGSAYRCYSSRFTKTNYLGNINDLNFKLNTQAMVCCKKICTCPKPQVYNQITDKTDKKEAQKQSLKNILYLPQMIFLRKDIVIQKIKHYLKLTKS